MSIAPVFISQSGGTKNSPSTSFSPSKAPISAQNHEAPLAELGTLRVRFAHPFYPTPRFAENPATEREGLTQNPARERERGVIQNPARERTELFKIQQEKEGDGVREESDEACTPTD